MEFPRQYIYAQWDRIVAPQQSKVQRSYAFKPGYKSEVGMVSRGGYFHSNHSQKAIDLSYA